ncbi:MAG: hypothetical protein EOM53_01070 [Alphaproteobacteria bacterium]|nr:hypothetical protein [Alphaproteobacteria bacterium]
MRITKVKVSKDNVEINQDKDGGKLVVGAKEYATSKEIRQFLTTSKAENLKKSFICSTFKNKFFAEAQKRDFQ